ncbi:MAG TPA: 50S ribosomal protein L25 [Candidatus Paceibacterota bacterium]
MELSVQKREKLGKTVKSLRKEGFIPAELYGRGVANVHVSVPVKDFKKIFKTAGENMVINVLLEGKRRSAMIHDISYHPVTDEILNVDFYEVRMDELIKVKVPLEFKGESSAVKDKGGVLVKAMQEVEVEALPGSIPHSLEVDLSKFVDLNSSVYVEDLKVSAGVKILVKPGTPVATVKEKAAEEVVAAPEASIESVKVETEEKKAERQAKKEVTAAPEAGRSEKAAPAK